LRAFSRRFSRLLARPATSLAARSFLTSSLRSSETFGLPFFFFSFSGASSPSSGNNGGVSSFFSGFFFFS